MTVFETRPLNRFERNMLNLDLASNFSFIVVAQGVGDLEVEILQQALAHVQRQHYYLNVSLDLTAKPTFVAHAGLPIPLRVITDADHKRWLAEAERELNTKFDLARGPLVRGAALTHAGEWEVIVTFMHLISDGVSGIQFVQEVITIYGQLAQGIALESTAPQDTAVPGEQYFPRNAFGVRGAFKLLELAVRYGYNALRFGKAHFPTPEWVPLERRDVRLTHDVLSPEETIQLVERCRAAQTTVQGALSAALLLTLAKELREKAGVPEPAIECASSVNTRPFCRGSVLDRQMGLWAGQVIQPYLIGPDTDFWTLARLIIRELRQALAADSIFVIYRVLCKKEYADSAALTRLLENAKPYVEVSNMGRLTFDAAHGPLTVTRLHAAASLQVQASPWGLTAAVTTFDGRLHINGHYLANYWDAAAAAHVAAAIRARLLRG